MNKFAKKFIAYLLVLVMLVPMFSLTVFANDDDDDDEIIIQDYTTLVYENIDAFLADMGRGSDGLPTGEPILTRYGFELF